MKLNYLCIVITAAFLSVSLSACSDEKTGVLATEFDRKAWLSAKGKSARQKMVKALEKELRLGISADEIIELMGEPDRKVDSESEKSYIYGLGRGLIDYQEYRIIFDDDWKLIKFMQLQG